MDKGKSILHVCEQHQTKDKYDFKYYVNLYKRYGEKLFINRENGVYRRDAKLIAISRVKNGESIRQVSLYFGLINYKILSDWVKKYNNEGEKAI